MAHEAPKRRHFPRRLVTVPVGSSAARRASLSRYLTGSFECVADRCYVDAQDVHRHTLGDRTYLAFASGEDLVSRLTRKVMANAHTFLSLARLQHYTCVDLGMLVEALSFDEEDDVKKAINYLVTTSCGWPYFVQEVINDFGPAVLLGSMDQVGCPWDEEIDGPQLCFRID